MASTTTYLPVQGTWGWGRGSALRWWQVGSPFHAFLAGHGLELLCPSDPFVWTSNLDGLKPWSRLNEWRCAGINLRQHLKPPLLSDELYVPYEKRNLIVHSHGLQVALYAAAGSEGAPRLRIHRLISIGSPVRDDMMDVARQARPNIGEWLHVHSDSSDRTQWLGGLFDGALGIVRTHPLADVNVGIPQVGHSGILEDPALFRHWTEDGLLDWLRRPTRELGAPPPGTVDHHDY